MKTMNHIFILSLIFLSFAVFECRNLRKHKENTKTQHSMMDLQIQSLKKKNLNQKLYLYAKNEKARILKEKKGGGNPNSGSIKTQSPPKNSSFNIFALFKDSPEKLLDFPFPFVSSFSQISSQEPTRHYVLSTMPISLNTQVRRKKLQHHEETFPLFSRI